MSVTDPHPFLRVIESCAVIAVVRSPSPELALQAIDTLIDAGITGIEVTFTTPDAPQVIAETIARHGNNALVGAGTVLTAHQAGAASDAGARFLVSPGTEANLARAMTETGLLTMTGALTPTEVMLAGSLGVDVIKIFPGSLGGASYLKSLRGPFPEARFMPTGGVTPDNVADWFASGAIAVGVGGELVPASALKKNDMGEIADRAQLFVDALVACGKRGNTL
jgi:2-dehydro-3-deoxyphosphogluconate aldolase/(4S)-4-hydroxy-2-oxoglutarate aldolase